MTIDKPRDDGFDEAFAIMHKNPNISFEEVCFLTRVNPRTFMKKLEWASRNINFLHIGDDKWDNMTTFYKAVDKVFSKTKAEPFIPKRGAKVRKA
mgnify:CR=1 FL=1